MSTLWLFSSLCSYSDESAQWPDAFLPVLICIMRGLSVCFSCCQQQMLRVVEALGMSYWQPALTILVKQPSLPRSILPPSTLPPFFHPRPRPPQAHCSDLQTYSREQLIPETTFRHECGLWVSSIYKAVHSRWKQLREGWCDVHQVHCGHLKNIPPLVQVRPWDYFADTEWQANLYQYCTCTFPYLSMRRCYFVKFYTLIY